MRSVAALLAVFLGSCAMAASPPLAPEFTHRNTGDWLNSPPQTLEALRGKVVLIEFWTFGCSNCRNTLPWLKAVHQRFKKEGLVVVSVHTPELNGTRSRSAQRSSGSAFLTQ